jgi:hypothetical protein
MTDDPAAEDSATADHSSPAGRGAYPADHAALADPDAQEAMELDDEIVVAEVIDESPDQSVTADAVTGAAASSAKSAPAAGDPLADGPVTGDAVAGAALADGPVTGTAASAAGSAPAAAMPADVDANGADRGLSQHWRNIQSTFVDDPSGAVSLAAEAADAAVSALVGSLQERQSALLSTTGDMASAHDTEQLRTALQEYRVFCQDIEEIGRRLPQPQAVAR